MKKVKRLAAILLLTGALTVTEHTLTAPYFDTTINDLINSQAFVTELKEIEETEDLEFTNPALIEQIEQQLGIKIDKNNIKTIYKIKLNLNGEEQSLEDLKYFTNLEDLTIVNGTFNAEDLQYNQSLGDLTVINCAITNTNKLPNSIETLALHATMVTDNLLYIPYNTTFVYIMQSGFNNIHLKNPKTLRYLNIDSNICTIDLTCLEECSDLLKLVIKTCPNVTNAKSLTKLSERCEIVLDDYAPIWLTEEIFNNLKNVNQTNAEEIKQETIYLDNLALELTKDCETDAEKIKAISNFIICNLKYSEAILTESPVKEEVAEILNAFPIKYAISLDNDFDEVCINYTCLFQALANRSNITSIQLMGDDHTWNQVNNHYLDLTSLDGAIFVTEDDARHYLEDLINEGRNIPEEYYYVRDETHPSYTIIYPFTSVTEIDENIGYVKPRTVSRKVKVLQVTSNLIFSIGLISILSVLKTIHNELKYNRLKKDIDKKLGRH